MGEHYGNFGEIRSIRILIKYLDICGFGYAIVKTKNGHYAHVQIIDRKNVLDEHVDLYASPLFPGIDVMNKFSPSAENLYNKEYLRQIIERLPLIELGIIADVSSKFGKFVKKIAVKRIVNGEKVFCNFATSTTISDRNDWPNRLYQLESFFRHFGHEIRSIEIFGTPIDLFKFKFYFTANFYKFAMLKLMLTYCFDDIKLFALTHLKIDGLIITPEWHGTLWPIFNRLKSLEINAGGIGKLLTVCTQLDHFSLGCVDRETIKYFIEMDHKNLKTLEFINPADFVMAFRKNNRNVRGDECDCTAYNDPLIAHFETLNMSKNSNGNGSEYMCNLKQLRNSFSKLRNLTTITLSECNEKDLQVLIEAITRSQVPINCLKINGSKVNSMTIESILKLNQIKEIQLDENKITSDHMKKLKGKFQIASNGCSSSGM